MVFVGKLVGLLTEQRNVGSNDVASTWPNGDSGYGYRIFVRKTTSKANKKIKMGGGELVCQKRDGKDCSGNGPVREFATSSF